MKKLPMMLLFALMVGCGDGDAESKAEPLDSRLAGEIISMSCDGLTAVYQVRLQGHALVSCMPRDNPMITCTGLVTELDGEWEGEVRCAQPEGRIGRLSCSDDRDVNGEVNARVELEPLRLEGGPVPGYKAQCP